MYLPSPQPLLPLVGFFSAAKNPKLSIEPPKNLELIVQAAEGSNVSLSAYQKMMDEVEQAWKSGMTARDFAKSKGVPSSLTDEEAALLDKYDVRMQLEGAGEGAAKAEGAQSAAGEKKFEGEAGETGGEGESNIQKTGDESKPIYSANGDPALRSKRRPDFDNMLNNGVEVRGVSFRLRIHAYNSLFKSGRKDIMPDDIIDALKSKPSPGEIGSVEYINSTTGTAVFVSTATDEIVGIWPNNFKR